MEIIEPPRDLPNDQADPAPSRDPGGAARPVTRFRRSELKVVLSPEEAARARDFARSQCVADPHALEDGSYPVHTLYLDSEALDAYHRTYDDDGTKFRIRRYGSEDLVWLERKRRRRSEVTKRRVGWRVDRLREILEGESLPAGWAGVFKKAIHQRRFEPRLLLSYQREAWVAGKGNRLTIDTQVIARTAHGRRPFDTASDPIPVSGQLILEVKYDDQRPAVFDDLLRHLGRESSSFSKYGRGIEAAGMAVARMRNPR